MHLPRNILITLTGALLGALALMVPSLWALVFPALALFLYALWFETKTVGGALWQGLAFGFVTAGAGIFWFWDTLPISWLADDVVTQVVAVGIIWALISFMLGLGTTLSAPLLWLVRNWVERPLGAVSILPAVGILWAVQEHFRMLFYGFVTLGGESLPGAHFSVSALAYGLVEHPYLLQAAYPSGIYSLSVALGVLSAGGVLLYRAARNHSVQRMIAPVALLLLVLVVPAITPSSSNTVGAPLRVALLTLDDNPESQQEKVMDTLLDDIVAARPDVVVLPESTTPPWLSKDPETRHALKERMHGRDVLFVYSEYRVLVSEESSAELIYEHLETGEQVTYQKRLLMPLGEYIPSFTKTAFALLSNETLRRRVDSLSGLLERGDSPAPAVAHSGYTFGALLCSENLSPKLYSDLARREGATVLVNLANITWFHNSPRVMHLLETLGKVHAVSHRTPFLLAAKGGYSFVVNPEGRTVAQSAPNQNSVLVYELNSSE